MNNTVFSSLCLTTLFLPALAACGTASNDLPDAAGLDAGVFDARVANDVRVAADGGADAGAPDTGEPDAGGATLESCFEGLEPGEDNFINTLDLESLDGELRVLLARERGAGMPAGETYPYQLVRFAIQRGDAVECITSSESLMWDYAHHNWDETVSADGDATYIVRLQYSFATDPAAWIDTLSIDGGDAISLRLRTCETMPSTDLNHCLSRSER